MYIMIQLHINNLLEFNKMKNLGEIFPKEDGITTNCLMVPFDSEFNQMLILNRFNFEYSESWGWARICIGWSVSERPFLAIKTLLAAREFFKETNLILFISSGNIQMMDKENLTDYYNDDINHTNVLINTINIFGEEIDNIKKDMSQLKEFGSFGLDLNIYDPLTKYTFFKYAILDKHTDKNWVYFSSHSVKDEAKKEIKAIKDVFKKYGDYNFLENKRSGECNGQWCLFITK